MKAGKHTWRKALSSFDSVRWLSLCSDAICGKFRVIHVRVKDSCLVDF